MSQGMPESATVERPPIEERRVRDELGTELERELVAEARDRDHREDDDGAQMFTDT